LPKLTPVVRSQDLPPTSSEVKAYYRILDATDRTWLGAHWGITLPTVITYAKIKQAVDAVPKLKNVRVKQESGRVRVDFEYDNPGPNARGKLLFEGSPSTHYSTSRLLDLDFIDFELFNLAKLAEPVLDDVVEDAIADLNGDLQSQVAPLLANLPSGVTMTLTSVSEQNDGLHLKYGIAYCVIT
jgi:hypothetical protein